MKKKKISLSLEGLQPVFDRIAKLTQLQRILICVGTYALLVAPFVWLSYLPKFEKIGKLEKELTELENNLRVAKTKAMQLRRFQAMLEEAKSKFEVAKRKLPQAKEIPDLLSNITASGQQAGLRFMLFQPGAESPKGFYAEIPVSIIVSGKYKDVAMFFDGIARLSRIVNIKGIKMSPDEKTEEITTSCTAVTYMFVEGK